MKILFLSYLLAYKYQSYGQDRMMQIAQDADHPLSKEFRAAIIINQEVSV